MVSRSASFEMRSTEDGSVTSHLNSRMSYCQISDIHSFVPALFLKTEKDMRFASAEIIFNKATLNDVKM